MLAWATAAALICAISATLGFSNLLSSNIGSQSVALLVSALAALVLLGAFEAYEAEGPKPEQED